MGDSEVLGVAYFRIRDPSTVDGQRVPPTRLVPWNDREVGVKRWGHTGRPVSSENYKDFTGE